jgi:hypothetical protein
MQACQSLAVKTALTGDIYKLRHRPPLLQLVVPSLDRQSLADRQSLDTNDTAMAKPRLQSSFAQIVEGQTSSWTIVKHLAQRFFPRDVALLLQHR